MRKAARARILGKRAAAAAKQARGGAGGGRGGAAKGGGGKARVFRRAKRDCRVMDARRKRLGAYLFCGKGTCVWYDVTRCYCCYCCYGMVWYGT